MAYVLYDIVNHQAEIFKDLDVAAVMILITQEDADLCDIDDRFLREPMSQDFTGTLVPWHYMLSVSEFFGVEGSHKLTCVSKDIFVALWNACPDKRHALYGGEKINKKSAQDLKPRRRVAEDSDDNYVVTDEDIGLFMECFNRVANSEGYADRNDIRKEWRKTDKARYLGHVLTKLREDNNPIYGMFL